MASFVRLYTPDDYLEFLGLERRGRDVAVVRFEDLQPRDFTQVIQIGYFGVFFHPEQHLDLVYGTEQVKFGEKGTLIFMAPGQIIRANTFGEEITANGYGLVFSPSSFDNTHLAKVITNFTFFNYEVTEALELNDNEKKEMEFFFSSKLLLNWKNQSIDFHTKYSPCL